jgi:AcrR family transcriptional regulator
MATDETRSRIIEVAGPIFAERGFRGATVRDICEAAGVGLASVNYHFRDKRHLYVRVVEEAFDDINRKRPPLKEWPPGTPVAVRLEEWIQRLATHVLASSRDSWPDRLLTREIHSPTPECEEVLQKRIAAEMAPLDAILEEVLPEMSAAGRRRVAFGIVGQVLIYDSHRDLVRLLQADGDGADLFDVARIVEFVLQATLAALGLAPPIRRAHGDEQR